MLTRSLSWTLAIGSMLCVSAAEAQQQYAVALTVHGVTGTDCSAGEDFAAPARLFIAPTPGADASIDGFLDLGRQRVYQFRGDPAQRLDLIAAGLPDGRADSYIELRTAGPEANAVVALAIDGSDCVVAASARLELVAEGALAAVEMRHTGASAAVYLLVEISRGDELAGRYAQAMSLGEAARWLAVTEVGEASHALGMAQLRIASVHWNTGRYDESVEVGERALAILRNVDGAAHDVVSASINLGLAYRDGRRHASAVELLQRTHAYAEKEFGADDLDTVSALYNLALVYMDLDLVDKALPAVERAYLHRTRTLGETNFSTLRTREALATLLRRTGRTREALELSDQTQRLYLSAHGAKHPYALHHQIVLAGMLLSMKDVDRSVALAQDALDALLATVGPQHASTARARRQLVRSYLGQRRFDLAEEELGRLAALAATWQGGRSRLEAEIRELRAVFFEAQGRWQEALAEVEAALAAFSDVFGPLAADFSHLQQRRGLLLVRQRRYDDAIPVLKNWVDGFERQRRSTGLSESQRRGLLADSHASYRQLAYAYLVTGQVAEAFQISEMTKARTLLDALATQNALASAGVEEKALTELNAQSFALARLNELIADGNADPQARLRLELERNRVDRDAQALRHSLARQHPRFAALSEVHLASAAEAAGLLAPGRFAISYMLAADRVYAFALAPGRPVTAFDLMPASAVRGFVQSMRALTTGGQDSAAVWRMADGTFVTAAQPPQTDAARVTDWRVVAAALGQALLGPMRANATSAERLYIIPDGPLAELPFDALILDGKPLVESTRITLVQSMSILALMRAREPRLDTTVDRILSVGDPVYASPRAVEALPARSLAMTVRRSYDTLYPAWPPLPGTRREVLAVKAAFEKPSRAAARRSVSVLLGADATEARLQGLNTAGVLRRFRFLHFAAHGFLSPDTPDLSALVLSQADTTASADGFITAAEWLGYRLDSDLVVMSACETGRGTELAGEGILGLPYALFVAGNRAAVLTLWKIADDSGARFVPRFFERVAAGAGPARALSDTKREFLRNPRTAHPMHWAGFALFGE